MAERFKAWETQNEEQLQKFILRIREAVQATGGRKCAIVYEADKESLMELLDVEQKCWY